MWKEPCGCCCPGRCCFGCHSCAYCDHGCYDFIRLLCSLLLLLLQARLWKYYGHYYPAATSDATAAPTLIADAAATTTILTSANHLDSTKTATLAMFASFQCNIMWAVLGFSTYFLKTRDRPSSCASTPTSKPQALDLQL